MAHPGQGPPEARLGLSATPDSVREGRRFVGGILRAWGHDALVETAALLVSELITNALLHARTGPEVVVLEHPSAVRIEVSDGSVRLPASKGYGTTATTGRGLVLVNRLAAAWGSERRGTGKVVWFELRRAAGAVRADVGRAKATAGAAAEPAGGEHLASRLGGWDEGTGEADAPSACVLVGAW